MRQTGPRFGCLAREKWSAPDDVLTCMVGGGSDTLLCEECGFPVAVCVDFAALAGKAFTCPRCKCENVVPG